MSTYRRMTRDILEGMKARRDEGWTLKAIAEHYRTTIQGVCRLLRRLAATPNPSQCALSECGVAFWPTRQGQQYCCRGHLKRGQMRRHVGITVAHQQCELPGCSKTVFRRGLVDRFCTKYHADAFRRGLSSGLYARLVGVGPQCIACEETLILDEHHVEHPGGRSNKEGPTVWLCPTHHAGIHRGVAEIVEGRYVSLAPSLLNQLRVKHPSVVSGFLAHGYSWADKA